MWRLVEAAGEATTGGLTINLETALQFVGVLVIVVVGIYSARSKLAVKNEQYLKEMNDTLYKDNVRLTQENERLKAERDVATRELAVEIARLVLNQALE